MFRKLNKKSGFTLIELLVVVLILAILMAVALPLYLSAVADSQKKTCRANMQTIANAVQARYVLFAGASTYTTITGAGINTANLPDLQAAPICPLAGTYTMDVTTPPYTIKCSVAAHGQFVPGIDHT